MIRVENVSKAYGETAVVRNISLTLPARSLTTIIGPNGAGKSTLLAMMSRLTSMDAGAISIDELNVSKTAGDVLARRLSILRQDNLVSSRLTVRELVTLGRYPHSKGRPTQDDLDHVQRSLAFLGIEALAERFLDELSGGQRQRAFVAMVLCQNTDYILLDEPLNGLDLKHAVSMMKLLRHAVDAIGKTVVMVLHDINFASCYSDRIVAMRDGQVVHHGPPHEIMRPEVLRSIYEVDVTIASVSGKPVGLYYF